jgi:hypothetical protein
MKLRRLALCRASDGRIMEDDDRTLERQIVGAPGASVRQGVFSPRDFGLTGGSGIFPR